MCWLLWNSQDSVTQICSLSPLFRWENWDQRFYFLRIAKLENGGAEIQTRAWAPKLTLLLTHVSLKHQSNIQCESHLSFSPFLSRTHTALLLKANIPKYLLVHAVSWWEWIKVSFKLGKGGPGLDHGFGSRCLARTLTCVWAYRCVPIVTHTRPWDFLVTPGFDFPSSSLRKTHCFFCGSYNTYYSHVC